jgi:hypothetical protein
VWKYGGDAASSGDGVTAASATHTGNEHANGIVNDRGKGELFGERSATAPLGPVQVRHAVSWYWTRATATKMWRNLSSTGTTTGLFS